jgi:hypothetical protein
MKSKIVLIIFTVLMLFRSEAQKPPSLYPFKGFHVGITGQLEFVQKPTFFSPFSLPDVEQHVPKGIWTYGWEAGMEFSYHFAKYFGVSIGINYGTALSYDCAIYWTVIHGFNDVWGTANDYEPLKLAMQDREIMFPIKLEFHFPLYKNLFFTADAGVKIKGIGLRLSYGKNATGNYSSGVGVLIRPIPDDDPNVPSDQIDYFDYWGTRNLSEITCNFLMGLGLYYKLPHGDLLRFTTGVNMSFKNIIEGYYYYHLSYNSGFFAVRNDFIYTQLSYIHTLNYKKAKRYLKKQEYSFASKKERRKKIFEMLNNW